MKSSVAGGDTLFGAHCFDASALQAIEDQLDARGNSQLFEDTEKIISHDLLLARGWTPGRVALTSAAVTAALCCIGFGALRVSGDIAAGLFAACFLLLSSLGVRLGITGPESKAVAPRAAKGKLFRIVS